MLGKPAPQTHTHASTAPSRCQRRPTEYGKHVAFWDRRDISSYLQSKGFKVPEDISIMGCNDEPSAALHNPPLTTIRFPLEEMGKRAMEEIDKQVNFGPTEHSNVIKLPVQLIERESCAPPAEV